MWRLLFVFPLLLLLLLLLVDRVNALGVTPLEVVASHVGSNAFLEVGPLARTVLFVPPVKFAERVVYRQDATRKHISGGWEEIRHACTAFDRDFQSDMGVQSHVCRISSGLSGSNLVLLSWNVTWVPPTALWLEALGQGIETIRVPYNDMSGHISTFSWKAVGRLFANVFLKGKLIVPLACIEGRTELRFRQDGRLEEITEYLSYAEDLRAGRLLNRRCAEDLRLFLETGRRCTVGWDELVRDCLPWRTVPGSGPLDLEPTEEGIEPALFAMTLATVIMLVFSNTILPELIGNPSEYYYDYSGFE